MYCGHRGLLLHFTAQLIRWNGLRSDGRPNVITLEERCAVCGQVWRQTYTATPVGSGPQKAIDPP